MILKTLLRYQLIHWAMEAFFNPVTNTLKSFSLFSGTVVKGMHFDIIKEIAFPNFYYDCVVTRFEENPKDLSAGRIKMCHYFVFEYLYQINTDKFYAQALVLDAYQSKFEEQLKLYGGSGFFENLGDGIGYYFSGPAGPFLSALSELTPYIEKTVLGCNNGLITDQFEFVKEAN